MPYEISKALLNPGAYFVHEIPDAFENVEEITLLEDIEGLNSSHALYTQFAISFDQKNWSLWKTWTTNNLKAEVIGKKSYYLKFKWILQQNLLEQPVLLKSYELKLLKKDKEKPVIEFAFHDMKKMSVGDYYGIGVTDFKITNSLNYWLNANFGTEVKYWHIEPKDSGIDPTLLNYTQYKEADSKLIKVMLTAGEFPENKPEINDWGYEFENFEIEIHKDYFEEIFGLNEKPRNNDFLYFCVQNKMYYISSNYLKRGTHELPTSYVLYLKTYEEDSSVEKSEETQEFLENFTLSVEETMKPIEEEDQVDVEDYQQNMLKTVQQEELRDEIHENNEIVLESITNNGSELLRNYYDFSRISSNEVAVRYLPNVICNKEQSFGYSSWIKLKEKTATLAFAITAQELVDGKLVVQLDKIPKYAGVYPDTFIKVGSDFYYVTAVDGIKLTLSKESLITQPMTECYAAETHNLFMMMGKESDIRLDIFERNLVRFSFGKYYKDYHMAEIPYGQWYNITFNINNEFNYIGFYIWTLNGGITPNSTFLELVEKQELVSDLCLSFDDTPMILGSKCNMGNIRFYNRAASFEYQSKINSVRTLPKASVAFIIDNCDTIFNSKNVGTSSTKPIDAYGKRITEGNQL